MDELFEQSQIQDIIFENLRQNGVQLINTLKKRRLYIGDLAKLIVSGEENTPVNLISENTVDKYNLLGDETGINTKVDEADLFYKGVIQLLDAQNIASLCRNIASRLDQSSLFVPKINEASRVCYFRNRFSDLAYLAFSKYLPEATVDYTYDYESACEGVYNGKYDYCIIPLSGFADGLMTRFIGLLEKYELRIVLSCDIPIREDEHMTFCLLSGSEVYFEGAKHMALTVLCRDSYPLWKFLCIAELLGAKCTECTSLPVRIYSEKSYFTLFDLEKCDKAAFWVYLQLSLPAYILDGVYKEIHQTT